MRKVVSGLFISLDGVAQDPHIWQADVFDDIMIEAMNDQLGSQDVVLLGRVTYDEWAPYWPSSTDEPFASYINNIPKYVVSTTLDDNLEWQNSTLTRNIAGTIAELKQQPGKNIGVAGSPTLVRSLLENGLLDELVLMIHPVIAGEGKHLFHDGDALRHLEIVDSKITGTGVAILTYRPHREA